MGVDAAVLDDLGPLLVILAASAAVESRDERGAVRVLHLCRMIVVFGDVPWDDDGVRTWDDGHVEAEEQLESGAAGLCCSIRVSDLIGLP